MNEWHTPQHHGLNDFKDDQHGLYDPAELVETFLDLAREAEQAGRADDANAYRRDAEQARKLRDGEL